MLSNEYTQSEDRPGSDRVVPLPDGDDDFAADNLNEAAVGEIDSVRALAAEDAGAALAKMPTLAARRRLV